MTRTVTGSGWYRFVGVLAVALTLTACGGGGSGGTASSNQSASVSPDTPSSPPTAGSPTPPPPSTGNQPPTVSGAAPTIAMAGKSYNFQPTAADADNDKITFAIANKPSWAQFNPATGELTGTPTDAQAGVYADVEIGATDGKDVSTLPRFAITVTKSVGTNGIALDWQAPSENTDGTPLTDLKGYKVHYGTAPQSYTGSIDIPGTSVQSYVVDQLPTGTYYLAVTAVNNLGVESDYSSEVRATLN